MLGRDAREVWPGGGWFPWPQDLRRWGWPEPQQLGGPGLPAGWHASMGLGTGTCKRQAQNQGSREARVQIRRGAVRVSGSASLSLSFLIFHRCERA